jgi:HEAT repeat protein
VLTPERAREALEDQRVADWEKRREGRIRSLPPKAARVARVLADANFWGYGIKEDCGPAIEAMRAREREALGEALLPGLGAHLERMWKAGRDRPYQVGWERRAFRAPSVPAVTLDARQARLVFVVKSLEGYEPDPVWVARWAPHLHWENGFGPFLAAVIDAGGVEADAVFEVLIASAEGEDEVGGMGRHVVGGLLSASRPDGWEFVERLLLAAQRQEGLRQVVLESVDEAHPDAFRRMLGLVREHDLARFSATVRALNVWLALGFGAGEVRAINAIVERLLRYLDDPEEGRRAVEDGEAEDAYLALWAAAFANAPAAVSLARPLLADSDPERRFAAVHLLAELGLTTAVEALAPALEDGDLRVAARALDGMRWTFSEGGPDVSEPLERLLTRLERPKTNLEPILWPWTGRVLEASTVGATLATHVEKRDPMRLLPHQKALDPFWRARLVPHLGEQARASPAARAALLECVGDPSPQVREAAFGALEKITVDEAEALTLEALLTRKAGDLRRGVTGLLVGLGERKALESADRLLAAGDRMQRLAGLEVLRRLVEEGHSDTEARRRAVAYRREREQLDEAERTQLDALVEREEETPTLDDALGLLDVEGLSPGLKPQRHDVALITEASLAALRDLDALADEHRDARVPLEGWLLEKEDEGLLGDADWRFPRPSRSLAPVRGEQVELSPERLPLREVWESWLAERPASTRDADGFELLRALVVPVKERRPQFPGFRHELPGEDALLPERRRPELDYPHVVQAVAEWLALLHLPREGPAFLLDAVETHLALVPRGELLSDPQPDIPGVTFGRTPTWRERGWLAYLELARTVRQLRPSFWSQEDQLRLWRLERWVEAPLETSTLTLTDRLRGLRARKAAKHVRPPVTEVLLAFRAGVASEADVIAHLLGPREEDGYSRFDFHGLVQLSGRHPEPFAQADPRLTEIVQRCRERILEVELARGEAPTAASGLALALRHSGGLDVLVRLLAALGRGRFVRGWSYDSESREVVFSRLIRATFPTPEETPRAFAERSRAAAIAERRLLELAAFAPQWARHVEAALEWPGLASSIWWFHAHTKDVSWTVEPEVREAWAADVAEQTPLSSPDLLDGAVDVEWFERAHGELGVEHWNALMAAAKYCSTGAGHKRAELFAEAMVGRIDELDLRSRIVEKRHQDSVRALGLMPLPRGKRKREGTVLERYELVQEFVRTSRQFGSQRQASERRAAEIGLANLARTAGYRDPLRLSWAMEARGVADLADGPLTVTVGDVEVSLQIGDDGKPEVETRKDGRVLKSVPAAARKNTEVKALRKRATDLRRQASRMRTSLEAAMVRGDVFEGSELRELCQHALLTPMLAGLVLLGEGIAGYPIAEGKALIDHSGKRHAVGAREALRLAHPVDLLQGGAWSSWQRDCLARHVLQPFKQVFRELYVPTTDELADAGISRRYGGHQLQPRKALALLGSRGWVAHPEEGVRRTYHDAGLSAGLIFLQGFFTPADVEELTLETVSFFKTESAELVPITDVPARLFSEAMRDLDLAVSVAHAGGVDPEASASTVEMRANLVGETCQLLEIENVRLDEPWVLVDGQLGEYSIHLGSAVVHRRPGGAVCIIPVHGQHRGRIFLPFADDDPKTAEVLSKVLLLARDSEIKDPTILEQLRSA